MTAFSDYLENELLDGTLRNLTYTPVATVYVGLHTSAPNDDDTGAEVATGSYARISSAFDAPAAGSSSNTATITFPTATASWGTVTHFGIYDAAAAGNLLYWGALTVSKTVDNGDIFTFPAGNLTVSLD